MNLIRAAQSVLDFTLATPSADGHSQIHRESRDGNFTPGFSIDSDAEIIEAVRYQAPAYGSGEICGLDQSEKSVFCVREVENCRDGTRPAGSSSSEGFRDSHFVMSACALLKQKKTQDAVEKRF